MPTVFLYLVEEVVGFHAGCGGMISIVPSKSGQENPYASESIFVECALCHQSFRFIRDREVLGVGSEELSD